MRLMAVSNARTFVRLIQFLRPYRSSLILSTILAVLSQAAAIAVIVLTGFVINELRGGQDGHYLAFLILCDPRRRPPARGAHARPALHLRQAGDRGRVGHARRALRAPAAALVRLLRPAPDRAADVAGDRRPADDPLLPRLRPDLLRAARDHDRLRHRRPLLLRLAAGADRARDHAASRRRRVPLQPRLASGAPRRAAEARRRRDRVGGVDRRHPRRQVVRPGGAGRGALPGRVGQRLRGERSREHAASALRAAADVPADARAGRRPARRGPLRRPGRPHDRRLLRLQPAADDARDAAADARHVDRPGAARDRLGRAVLRGDRRARGGRGRARRRRAAAGPGPRRLRGRRLRLRPRAAGARRDRPRDRGRQHDRADRRLGVGQDDARLARAALLRRRRGPRADRRRRRARRDAALAAPRGRRHLAGSVPLLDERARQHRLRRAGRRHRSSSRPRRGRRRRTRSSRSCPTATTP